MSFASTSSNYSSFEVDLLIDDIDINPFWSSDEEDDVTEKDNDKIENKNNQKNAEQGEITPNDINSIDPKRDSGIVLIDSSASDVRYTNEAEGEEDDMFTQEISEKWNNELNKHTDIGNKTELTRVSSVGNKNNSYSLRNVDGSIRIVQENQKSESSNGLASITSALMKKKQLHKTQSCPNPKMMHWIDAIEKSKFMEDPWEKYDIIGTCPTERARRFRYNALQKKWVQDEVLVKMQTERFGKGAMRECFRMKKLSTLVHANDWHYASNIVAKKYFDDDVLPKTYFDDVKLQMDAKLWAEEYNRHHPPKKIDIIQVGLLKMLDRENQPMYHIEHFVEGKYVKYNSNSGFVLREDETVRSTPQAFSHFTFERSGHQMIVVDIQGVGDLYTDPQIHTARCDEYGEANLGTRGMALFFATHECSQICEDLNLEKFDLSDNEVRRLQEVSSENSTATEVKNSVGSPGVKMEPMFDLVERLISSSSDGDNESCDDPLSEPSLSRQNSGITTPKFGNHLSVGRQRMYSEADSGINSEDEANSHDQFFEKHIKKVSCVESDAVCRILSSDTIARRLEALANFEEEQTSILSQVHYDLATYNYIGRFTDSQPDMDSTKYHLEKAAMSGCLQANKILAFKYSQISTEEFAELEIEENCDFAMDCFIEAASRGDRDSMVRTAEAFDTGINLGTSRSLSWTEALKWYAAALQQHDTNKTFGTKQNYEINARMAEIWRQGGNGVEKDPSYAGELYSTAAEEAMSSGKGKLSNKYYMLAEEAWGEVEEE